MATIQDMIDETEESLRNAPQNIVFARQSAVDNSEPLGSLFANLSPALVSANNTPGGSSVYQIASHAAIQRGILQGFSTDDILLFKLPTPTDLTLPSFTFPTESNFSFVAYDLDLSPFTVTIPSDLYIVQDRVTNDLVSIDDSPVPYLSPNAGTPFLPLNIANGKTVTDTNTANTPPPVDISSTRFDFELSSDRNFVFTEYSPDIFTQVEFVSVTGTFISGETLTGISNGETSSASVRDFLVENTNRRTATLNISDLSDTEFPEALFVTGQVSGATGIVSTKVANSAWIITSNVSIEVDSRIRDLDEVSAQNYWLKDFNFVIPTFIDNSNSEFPVMTIPTVNSAPKIFKTFPLKQFSDNEIVANMIVNTEGLKMNVDFDVFGTVDTDPPELSVILGSQEFRNIFNYAGRTDDLNDQILQSLKPENISSGQEIGGIYPNIARNPFFPSVGDATETQPANTGIDDIQNNLYAGFFEQIEDRGGDNSRYIVLTEQTWNMGINPLVGFDRTNVEPGATAFPNTINAIITSEDSNTSFNALVTANDTATSAGPSIPEFRIFFDTRLGVDSPSTRRITKFTANGSFPDIPSPAADNIYNKIQEELLTEENMLLRDLIQRLGNHGTIIDTIYGMDGLANTANGISDSDFNSIIPDPNTIEDFVEIHEYWLVSQFDQGILESVNSPQEFDYNELLGGNNPLFVTIGIESVEATIELDNIYNDEGFFRPYDTWLEVLTRLEDLFEPDPDDRGLPMERRIIELNARLGRVAEQEDSNNSGSFLPAEGYTKDIYDSVNPMLRGYTEYLQNIIDDLENIQVLFDEITNLRNKRTALLQARGGNLN